MQQVTNSKSREPTKLKKYQIWHSLPLSEQKKINTSMIVIQDSKWYTLYDYLRGKISEMIKEYTTLLSVSSLHHPSPLYYTVKKVFTHLSVKDFFVASMLVLDEVLPGSSHEYTAVIQEFYQSNTELLQKYKENLVLGQVEQIRPENYSITLLNASCDLSQHITSWDPEHFMKTARLSRIFPFIGMIPYKNYKTGVPHVKTHSSLDETIINEWIFNNNKVREYKGVTVKINTKDGYQTININRFTPKVSVKVQGYGKQCKQLVSETKGYLVDFIKFYNGTNISKEALDVIVTSLSVKIPFMDKKGASFSIDLPSFRKYFQQWGAYPLEKTRSSVRFHIDKSIYIVNEDSVTIFGIPNISHIQPVINTLVKIVSTIERKHTVSLFKKTSQASSSKITKNITNVNPVDCQKSRQATLASKKEDTVEYNGDYFVCSNKEYPFFGFTSQGNVCCFKKSQVNKPIYLLKTGKKKPVHYKEKDMRILSKTPITTDKPVPEYRIGIILEKAQKLIKGFGTGTLYRLGNPGRNIVSAVSYALQKDISKILSQNATESLYRSLLKGEFYHRTPFITWKELVRSGSYGSFSEDVIIDFIEKSLQIQLQIASIEIKRVTTTTSLEISKYNRCYENTVTLVKYIRKEGLFYEPVICVTPGNNIVYTTKSTLCSKKSYPYTVKAQYLDNYNKVEYLLTDKGVLPVSVLGRERNPEPHIPMITGFPDKGRLSVTQQLACIKELGLRPLFQILTPRGVSGLIVQKSSYTGIIPVLTGKKPIKDVPVSYTFYNDNVNTILDSSYEIETITWSRYYKELFQRFQLLLSPSVYKEVQSIVRNTSTSYNTKFEKIRGILKNVYNEKTLLFKAVDLPQALPKVRYTCTEEDISAFCRDKKLIIDKHISEAFIDKITTLFLLGHYPVTSKKAHERKKVNDYFIRPTEVIYTKKEDYKKLQKNRK